MMNMNALSVLIGLSAFVVATLSVLMGANAVTGYDAGLSQVTGLISIAFAFWAVVEAQP